MDADFMYAHPAALRSTRDFAERRRAKPDRAEMNRLYCIESTPSVTGSNADHRLASGPAETERFARALAHRLGAASDTAATQAVAAHGHWLSALADDLQHSQGSSLVIVGEQQPPLTHAIGHALNLALGNVGMTVRYTESAEARPVDQLQSLRQLTEELRDGAVDVLLVGAVDNQAVSRWGSP